MSAQILGEIVIYGTVACSNVFEPPNEKHAVLPSAPDQLVPEFFNIYHSLFTVKRGQVFVQALAVDGQVLGVLHK